MIRIINTLFYNQSMKLSLGKITPLLFFSVFLAAFSAGNFTLTEFRASLSEENSNEITVIWMAENDGQVSEYELLRKMPQDQEFYSIDMKDPRPSMGPVEYSYTDRSVFKSQARGEQVIYKLKAHFTDGRVEELGQTDINYISSGVRRTWGSIKRMFQ